MAPDASTRSGERAIRCGEKVRSGFSSPRNYSRSITSRRMTRQEWRTTGTRGLPASAKRASGLPSRLTTSAHSKGGSESTEAVAPNQALQQTAPSAVAPGSESLEGAAAELGVRRQGRKWDGGGA